MAIPHSSNLVKRRHSPSVTGGEVFGIWDGGSGYAPSGAHDLEHWESLYHAEAALIQRHFDTFRNQRFDYVYRPETHTGTPGVDGSLIKIYMFRHLPADPADFQEIDGEADYYIFMTEGGNAVTSEEYPQHWLAG